jgi:hypothetical protein
MCGLYTGYTHYMRNTHDIDRSGPASYSGFWPGRLDNLNDLDNLGNNRPLKALPG